MRYGGDAGGGYGGQAGHTIVGAPIIFHASGYSAWQVNPHFVPIADASFSIGNYTERVHNFYIAGNFKGSREVTLTESVATQVYAIVLAAGERVGGFLNYSIYASDGTDHQLFTSRVPFSAVNKAGTITVAMTPAAPDQSNDSNAGLVTAGSMAYAVTTTTTATEVRFHITALSSLTQTLLRAEVRLDMLRPQLTDPE